MPIDRGTIDQQLSGLGESARWDQRELRDLPAVLHADERILAISRGKIARLRIGLFRGRVIVVTAAHTYKLLEAASSLASNGEQAISFGPTRIVRRVVDHVLAMPAAAMNPNAQLPAPRSQTDPSVRDRRIDLLEEQVQQLQQQVDFLEQLLRRRQVQVEAGSFSE